jgi:predicted aldo/keto reductase-like oxidoreductase
MEKRILGRTGLEVSVIGFGGIPIQGISDAAAERVLNEALDRGIDLIDTARGYSDSEAKIGRAVAHRRGEYTLASKSMARDARGMREELETSLRDLRTDHIDLYQLHAVAGDEQLEQVLGPGGAYEELDRARQQGKLRFIGVTGHSRETLAKELRTGLFDTAQLPFNPLETAWLEEVIPAAREVNAGLIGMKPLAGGALGDPAAALRFALHEGVDVVIPGMDSVAQVRQNAAVGVGLRPPDEAETAGFEREQQRWEGHFCRRCGYCKPCPNGLDIPFLLLIEAYYTRYHLERWALDRLAGLDKHYADCEACGECVERCPYDLPVPELMEQAAKVVVPPPRPAPARGGSGR